MKDFFSWRPKVFRRPGVWLGKRRVKSSAALLASVGGLFLSVPAAAYLKQLQDLSEAEMKTAAGSAKADVYRAAVYGLPLVGAVTGIFYSVLGNKLHDRLKARARNKLNKPEEFFKNHDLSRAVGHAVEMMLLDAANAREGDPLPFPKDPEVRRWLEDVASIAPIAWRSCLEKDFQSHCPKWTQVLEQSLFAFVEDRQKSALSRELWMVFLKRLNGWQPSVIDTRVTSARAICDRLAARFGEALWEVIKNDAAGDGYAAEAMHLIISAELLRRTRATAAATERMKNVLEKMEDEWKANHRAVQQTLESHGVKLDKIMTLGQQYLHSIDEKASIIMAQNERLWQALQGGASTADAALAAERALRATLDAQLQEQRQANASLQTELQQTRAELAEARAGRSGESGPYMAAAVREAARLLAQGQELESRRTAAIASGDYVAATAVHQELLATRAALRAKAPRGTEAERLQWEDEDVQDSLVTGGLAFRQKDWSAAEIALKAVLELRPDHAVALAAYGTLLALLPGRAAESEEKFQAALRVCPDDADMLHNYGGLLLTQSGRAADAEAKFQAALRIRPDDANFLTSYGTLLAVRLARPQEAEEMFRAALRSRPDNATTLSNYGRLLMNSPGRAADAEDRFQAALRVCPDDVATLHNYGTLLMNLPGRAADAEDKFQAALRIRPDDADVLFGYGNLLMNLRGRAADAEEKFLAALRIRPDHVETLGNYGNLLMNHLGRAADAEEKFLAALRIRPDHAESLGNYGNLLWSQLGRAVEAEEKYKALLRIHPNDANSLYNYGTFLAMRKDRVEEAEVKFQAALRICPDHAPTLFNYGLLLANLPGRAADAEEKYKAILRIHPDNEKTLLAYASLLVSLPGRATDLSQVYQDLLHIRPDDARILHNYAVLLWKNLRDYARAKQMFARAFAADPKAPVIQRAYEAFMLDYQQQRL